MYANKAKSKCKKCNKPGHVTRDCWADYTCGYCKKKCHIKRVCKKRKSNESSKDDEKLLPRRNVDIANM